MSAYSYEDCLQKSYRVNWKISDVVDGRHFDVSRRWLPARLSGASATRALSEAEKIKLSHVEMGAYAHLFGYVEEFIAPTMVARANDFARYTFIESGVTHPNFQELFGLVTTAAQQEKVQKALIPILAPVA